MINRKSMFTLSALCILFLTGQHAALAADVTGTLIRTINTSTFNPPSPDPSGLAYLSSNNTLLVLDGEVEEMSIYNGANLFGMGLTGVLQSTSNTLAYSDEPVGGAFNPNNGHLFISSDDDKRVYEINPGSDGNLFTNDDIRTSFSTSGLCGSGDPEGLAYGEGTIFIIDGVNAEVYKVTPGPDGLFNGVGETCTQFDTASLGVTDPEGGEYDPDNPGHLYIVGKPKGELAYLTTSGTLVRTIGTAAANPLKPAGLAAVSKITTGDNTTHVYIADRGIDNDPDPNENDGKVYQFSISTGPAGNQAPTVAAGPDQYIGATADATLGGTVADDGLPNPPGQVTTNWSQVSGPGNVTFANANSVDTTASFPSVGSYVLRLTANDSALSRSDDVRINVQSQASPFTTIYVTTVNAGTVNGIAFGDEDILAYDISTGAWSMYFDGSDVGLGASGTEVDAFQIMPNGSILLSFAATSTTIPGLGAVANSDIVRFIPTSLGDITAGTFEWYFDGSDVELTTSGENIDAIGFAPDGRLVISTTDSPTVTGVSGATDEDLLAFTPTSLGEATSGTWVLYFDGSNVELSQSSSEDVNGTMIDDNGDIYLTTLGTFAVTGANGGPADIFKCSPSSLGANTTACSYEFVWNGVGSGLPQGAIVNGIDLVRSTGTPTNQAPVVNAGLDQSISLPNSAALNGTVTDDGLPVGSTVATTWSMVSGPGTVTFANAGTEDTTAGFSTEGTYVLRLTANDTQLSAFDEVTVTVNPTGGTPTNQAPVVNAGLDQSISLPNSAALNGTVTDDGLPAGSTVATTWSKVSGPGTVTFANAGTEDTTASFSTEGTYVLRLTANDTQLSAFDEVTITVNPTGTQVTTLAVRVSSSTDDAEQILSTGVMDLASSDLELILDVDGIQTVGLRFNAITIPKSATITNAYVQFTVDETGSTATTLQIAGQAVDNATTFTTATGNISSRPKTGASVSWSPAAWPSVGAAGPDQRTPNITTVIQEIINRTGWASGNSLAIIVNGSGNKRVAEAFNGVPAAAPLLHVEYTVN